jgi:hypothetical protein
MTPCIKKRIRTTGREQDIPSEQATCYPAFLRFRSRGFPCKYSVLPSLVQRLAYGFRVEVGYDANRLPAPLGEDVGDSGGWPQTKHHLTFSEPALCIESTPGLRILIVTLGRSR